MKAASRILNMAAELANIKRRLPAGALHMTCGIEIA